MGFKIGNHWCIVFFENKGGYNVIDNGVCGRKMLTDFCDHYMAI